MTRPVLAIALLLAAGAAAARAEVWEDPPLDDALLAAELVVRVRAPEEGSRGAARVPFTVERVLQGRTRAETLRVGGFHDPALSEGPVFGEGEELYLVLVRDEEGRLQVPTPTFGRFPIRDGDVRYAVLRGTFLRVTLPCADFERFLALLRGERDAEWLDGLRRHLSEGGPADEGPARMRHYLALEALARVGRPRDAMLARPYLDAETAPFQMRVSACRVLAQCQGRGATGTLLRAAREDPEPAVRTAAIRLLADLEPPPSGLVKRLAPLLAEAPTEPVRFAGPRDPRLNRWPAPKAAILQAIRDLGPRPVKDRLLALLDGEEEPEVFSAALEALLELEDDPALPRQLVDRFREPGTVGARVFNDELCVALTRLTDRDHGRDVAAWRAWAEEEER